MKTNQQSHPIASNTKQVEEDLSTRPVEQQDHLVNDHNQERQPTHEVTDEGGELSSYQLARDKSSLEIKTLVRFAQANLIAYAINSGDQLEHETLPHIKQPVKAKKGSFGLGL